jgi:hypothetical protein
MRDAVYNTLDQAKGAYDNAFKLKKKHFTEDKATKRTPIKEAAVIQ